MRRHAPAAQLAVRLLVCAVTTAGCATAAAPLAPRARSCRTRGSSVYALPDPRCTPGAIDSSVTQFDVRATICRLGYTRAVRPPEWITEPEKRASLAVYGEAGPLRAYEFDHLIPLELGGAANDPRNLWPEPGASPNPKDGLEERLHSLVCSGAMTLAAARHEIAADWVAAYRRLGLTSASWSTAFPASSR